MLAASSKHRNVCLFYTIFVSVKWLGSSCSLILRHWPWNLMFSDILEASSVNLICSCARNSLSMSQCKTYNNRKTEQQNGSKRSRIHKLIILFVEQCFRNPCMPTRGARRNIVAAWRVVVRVNKSLGPWLDMRHVHLPASTTESHLKGVCKWRCCTGPWGSPGPQNAVFLLMPHTHEVTWQKRIMIILSSVMVPDEHPDSRASP